MAFEKGAFLRQTIRCHATEAGQLTMEFDPREGNYAPWWHALSVTVHGWAAPTTVRMGGPKITAEHDPSARALRFTLPDMPTGGEVSIGGV
jgi:hypothetical protein